MKVLQFTDLGQTGGLDKTFPPADPAVTGSGNTVHDAAVAAAFATVLSAGSFTDLAGVLHTVQTCTYYEHVRLNAVGDFDGGDKVVTTGNPYNRTTSTSSTGAFSFTGGVSVGADLAVTGNATVGGNLAVTGTFAPTGDQAVTNMTVGGTLGVTGAATLTGNTDIEGTLNVDGATTLAGVTNTGNETITGTLGVTGATTLTGNTDIEGTLNVDGVSTFAGSVNTGNATIGGTLGVTGALAVGGTIAPQSHATAGGPAWVEGLIYYDTTLHKLRVGGAAAWETITSA